MRAPLSLLAYLANFVRDIAACGTGTETPAHNRHSVATSMGEGGMTWLVEPQKTDIVNRHIHFRDEADATDMEPLTWNETLLEAVTESGQVHCSSVSNGDDTRRVERQVTGFKRVAQSAFWWLGAYHDENMNQVVMNDWAAQYRRNAYKPATGECTDYESCAPYRQIVWAKTTAIACGILKCPTQGETHHHFLCYYAPAFEEGEKAYTPRVQD